MALPKLSAVEIISSTYWLDMKNMVVNKKVSYIRFYHPNHPRLYDSSQSKYIKNTSNFRRGKELPVDVIFVKQRVLGPDCAKP